MTETLLQKLEERTISLLTELERLRNEIKHLKHDNFTLRSEKDSNTRKLQDLMSLLDSTTSTDTAGEPIYLQSEAVNVA